MDQSGSESQFKYWAFISYSQKDKKWAKWLHKKIETYKIPKNVVDLKNYEILGNSRKLSPIFMDREELPTSSDLGNSILKALQFSMFLIVICSPSSAKSKWVNEEIAYFKRLGRENKILCLIIDGEPNTNNTNSLTCAECFPLAIRVNSNLNPIDLKEYSEPLAADIRVGMDGRKNALLKIVAGILEIEFDKLKQRDRKRSQVRNVIVTSLSVLLISVLSVITTIALINYSTTKRLQTERYGNIARESLLQGDFAEGIKLLEKALDCAPTEHIKYYSNIMRSWLARFEKLNSPNNSRLAAMALFTFQGNVYCYQDGKITYISKGKPSFGAYDKTSKRVILGFDQHITFQIYIYNAVDGSLIISHEIPMQEKGDEIAYGGPPLKLTDDQYIFPVYETGSYVGAYVQFLLYVDIQGIFKRLAWGNGSHSIDMEGKHLQVPEEDVQWLSIIMKGKKTYLKSIQSEQWLDYPLHKANHFWQKHFIGSGVKSDAIGREHPFNGVGELEIIPISEEKMWSERIASTEVASKEGYIIEDKDMWLIDDETGTLAYTEVASQNSFDVGALLNYLFLGGVLYERNSDFHIIRSINSGTHGINYNFCKLKNINILFNTSLNIGNKNEYYKVIKGEWGSGPENDSIATEKSFCFEKDGLRLLGGPHISNKHLSFFKPVYHNKSKLLFVFDHNKGEMLEVEIPTIKGDEIRVVASSKRPYEFIALYGRYIVTYKYDSKNNIFKILKQIELPLATKEIINILSMQISYDENYIILTQNGTVISVNSETGFQNWRFHVDNVDRTTLLINSEAFEHFGIIGPVGFQLFDSIKGIPLSQPFDVNFDNDKYISEPVQTFIKIKKDGSVVWGLWEVNRDTEKEATIIMLHIYRREPPIQLNHTKFKETINSIGIQDYDIMKPLRLDKIM